MSQKIKRFIENNMNRNGSLVGQHTVSINSTEKPGFQLQWR